jgi:phosphoribosylaminoimidazole-succinocarboxamide synthase
METVFTTEIPGLKLIRKGKVRDIYDLGDKLLFIATDRISAFDVVMNEPIPEKGSILSSISAYWFENTKQLMPNHFITNLVEDYPAECKEYAQLLTGRSMLVRKCTTLPVECIVRGYLAGSGWKEYQKTQTICSIPIPSGLKEYSRLPEPIFTPSTKAEVGHDENITFEVAADLVGIEIAKKIRDYSIQLFKYATDKLEKNGLILADTKFEFGVNEKGDIILIDEVLTPDSSRFWLIEDYSAGKPQSNFDKQVLRDYLESIQWNKQPPPPTLPEEIIRATTGKYIEARRRIIGK